MILVNELEYDYSNHTDELIFVGFLFQLDPNIYSILFSF
jgi:hypothetical protein